MDGQAHTEDGADEEELDDIPKGWGRTLSGRLERKGKEKSEEQW